MCVSVPPLHCLQTQTCRFSGLRIYPGKGILFIRVDGQVTEATARLGGGGGC